MKIYYHPASTTSRPLVLFAEENGVKVDFQVVDLFTGEHYQPPYEAVNPNRLMPTLEDIAVEVDPVTLGSKFAEGKAKGIETRGVSDHGFIHSIYFRDPNGYVIELTTKTPGHDQAMDPASNGARAKLDRWQAAKQPAATSKA